MFVGGADLNPLREVHDAQRGDVGDAVGAAGDELGIVEGGVQPLEEALRRGASPFHQAGHRRHAFAAGNGAVGERRIAVAEGIRHRAHAVELHVPFGGGDGGLGLRVRAEQRRLGVLGLEVRADGHRLVDHGAVVEHEGGQQAARIDGAELGAEILPAWDVHLFGLHLDALFGEEDAYPARVRRHLEVVEFHRLSSGKDARTIQRGVDSSTVAP